VAWPSPGSAIFTAAALNPILGRCWTTAAPTGYSSLSADALKAALYGNTGTPNKDDTLANTGYNTGQWVTANEITGTGYTAGGATLASKTFASATGAVNFGAANPSWTSATITAYGDLVYDSSITGGTVANQGLAFHYFGGSASVTSGTFTVQFSSGNVFSFSFAYN
jgi:hypothetical protein